MKRHVLVVLCLLAPLVTQAEESMMNDEAETIIDLERRALARWIDGDPTGFLEIIADDYTYFDPYRQERLDGLPAITAYYRELAGQVHADFQKFFRPRVQVFGDTAVLTFQFRAWDTGEPEPVDPKWNTTEIFHRYPDGWKLVHTHWAFTKTQELDTSP